MICANGHTFTADDDGAVKLQDGIWLCGCCVDELLTLRIPSRDGGEERKPPMKSSSKWKSVKRDWQL
jgi:hypothetical protein